MLQVFQEVVNFCLHLFLMRADVLAELSSGFSTPRKLKTAGLAQQRRMWARRASGFPLESRPSKD